MADRSGPELWADAGAAIETLLATLRRSAADEPLPPAQLLAEAYLIALSSGLRCAGEFAASCYRKRDVLAALLLAGEGGAPVQTETHSGAELRALARELGEAAVLEARRFQAELEALAARIGGP